MMHSIHRLVAIAFIPNPDNKPQVNHKDGNKSNNAVWNLEWVTNSENLIHAFETNLLKSRPGEEHHNASITDDDARYICELLSTNLYSYDEIANIVGTSYTVVRKIKTKNRWKHISKDYDFSNYMTKKERNKMYKNKNTISVKKLTETS